MLWGWKSVEMKNEHEINLIFPTQTEEQIPLPSHFSPDSTCAQLSVSGPASQTHLQAEAAGLGRAPAIISHYHGLQPPFSKNRHSKYWNHYSPRQNGLKQQRIIELPCTASHYPQYCKSKALAYAVQEKGMQMEAFILLNSPCLNIPQFCTHKKCSGSGKGHRAQSCRAPRWELSGNVRAGRQWAAEAGRNAVPFHQQ